MSWLQCSSDNIYYFVRCELDTFFFLYYAYWIMSDQHNPLENGFIYLRSTSFFVSIHCKSSQEPLASSNYLKFEMHSNTVTFISGIY